MQKKLTDQLYTFLHRQFLTVTRGTGAGNRWTPEEDATLRHLVATKGHCWAAIRNEMGKADPRSRWQKLERRDSHVKTGRWSPEETSAFLQHMLYLLVRDRTLDPHEFCSWSELAAYVRVRDEGQCAIHWRKSVQKVAREVNELVIWFLAQQDAGIQVMTDDTHELMVEPPMTLDMLTSVCHVHNLEPWLEADDLNLIEYLITEFSEASDESDVIWYVVLQPGCWKGRSEIFLRDRWMSLRNSIPEYAAETFLGMLLFL
jgi:hypothetical protein